MFFCFSKKLGISPSFKEPNNKLKKLDLKVNISHKKLPLSDTGFQSQFFQQ